MISRRSRTGVTQRLWSATPKLTARSHCRSPNAINSSTASSARSFCATRSAAGTCKAISSKPGSPRRSAPHFSPQWALAKPKPLPTHTRTTRWRRHRADPAPVIYSLPADDVTILREPQSDINDELNRTEETAMTDLRVITSDGGDRILEERTVSDFTASLRGPLLRPGDGGYDEVRKVWNGMIERRP